MPIVRPNDLTSTDFPVPHRSLGTFLEVQPLLELCRRGKLYEVEAWIDTGRPLQFSASADRKLQRRATVLGIAIDQGFHTATISLGTWASARWPSTSCRC